MQWGRLLLARASFRGRALARSCPEPSGWAQRSLAAAQVASHGLMQLLLFGRVCRQRSWDEAMQSVLLLPRPRSLLDELLPPNRRNLQPRLDWPHIPALTIADAKLRRYCRLEDAGAVASLHSLCFAVALVVVAAPAGVQLACEVARARQRTMPMHNAGVRGAMRNARRVNARCADARYVYSRYKTLCDEQRVMRDSRCLRR
jgi:hypothetical protein